MTIEYYNHRTKELLEALTEAKVLMKEVPLDVLATGDEEVFYMVFRLYVLIENLRVAIAELNRTWQEEEKERKEVNQ